MGFRDSDTIIEPIDDGGAFDSGEGSTSSTSESAANALAAANSAAAALVSENAAAADVALTAADVVLTNADVVSTNADVVLTHADVVLAEADKVQTGLDRIATNADVVLTNADVVLTHADVVLAEADKVQTGLDRIAVAADLVLTNQDTIDTAADVLLTNADVVLTHADVVLAEADKVQTGLDRVATNADVVLTHADVVLTNADVVLTHADVVLAEADKVQTGLDRIAVAADLVLTNQDTIDTAADVLLTNADVVLTNADVVLTHADVVLAEADKVQTGLDRTATTNSATSAATSASTATTKASEASTSATNAATSEANAETAETNAETAETNALASKNAAATSETNSSNSATASANSASSAATSETNAATSASTASSQASTATTKASEASTSATSAATSASTATTKASESSTSATNAATSASNSASSATAAQTAETNAETAETNAAASATTATTKAGESLTSANSSASSASTAEAAKDAALAALDSFDDRYLGAKSSDPTVDNDGNALISGALYYNTTDDAMKVYTGSAWVAAYASLAGTLLIANNLNDLDNAVSARSNLGLVIGTNVQAFSAILAATTASYTTALNNKLSGIELGATTDQTGAEIKTAYQAEANAFTDSLYTKLDNIEELADVTDTANVVSSLTAGSNITIAADGTISGSAAYSLPTSSPTVLGGVKVGTDLSISGTGVLSIADNVIDEANLKVSNSPTNGYFLSAQSGNVGGLTWATVPAGYDDADVTSYLASASSIGIGTSSPGSYDGEADNLVVASSGHTGITIASTGSNQRTNLYFSDGTSGSAAYRGGFSYDHNDDSLLVRTAGAEAMRLSSEGDLMHGTTNASLFSATSGSGTLIEPTGVVTIARQTTAATQPLFILNSTGVDGTLAQFRKDGATVGSIGNSGTALLLENPNTNSYIAFHANNQSTGIFYQDGATKYLAPYTARNNEFDLGNQNGKWKDLYLSGNIIVGGTVDGRDVAADGTKLDGIETGATADQTAAQILTAVKTVDGSGSGLDADLLDGVQGNKYFTSYNNAGTTGWEDSNRNFRINGGGTSVGFAMHESDGTFGFNLYADGTNYGFLDANWGNWDLKKVTNGALYVDEGSGLQRVFNDGYHPNADILTTARTINGVSFNGSANITVADSTKLPLAGGAMTGAITTNSTFDGRDVATDGAKLDGIAAGANNYSLPASPSVTNLNVATSIIHTGDTNTSINFDTDQISIAVGGSSEVYVNTTGVRLGDSGNGYFQPVSGNYGSTQIDGGAHGGWEGYSIGGRIVFMHDNSTVAGIYNDVDNEWFFLGTRNGETRMYYNGTSKFETTSGGAQVNGSLAVTGTVDGRDVATDGTKLDTIATSANNYSLPATPSVTGINIGSQVNLAESTDRADLLQITSSTSGWGGLQIRNSSNEGRWSFMTNGESGGIYNDEDDQWHVYFTEGAGTNLYYAGNAAAFTTSTGFTINGSLVLTGTGNVTLTGTVDGRDVAADGAKLDGIEAGATAGSGLPLSGGTMTGSINLNNNGLTGCSSITAINDTNTYIQFHAADQFRVVTGGSERLEVTSSQITSTVFISAPYFEATSDINLKTDIKKIVNPLEMISNLNGYTFNWKESGKASAGVIAQEVEKVLPSAVSENDKGTRSVNYNEIIGVLIEAVKEQQVQINSLKKMLGDN